MESGHVGQRVRYWRARRGITRQHFADLVGKSASWVDKVESGERNLDRLSVLELVAEKLAVPLQVLLEDEAFRRRAECVDGPEIAALRKVLQHPGQVGGCRPSPASPREPDLPRLERQVTYAWLAFQASDYTRLAPILAGLVAETERTRAELDGDERVIATGLLSQAYQIITSTTRKLGHWDLEWIAAERAMAMAEQTDDVVLFGGAAFRLVNALRDNSGAAAAVDLARAGAEHLDAVAGPSQPGPARSLYGHLLLQGAMSASAAQDQAAVSQLLAEAERAGTVVGEGRNDFWTAFGPTNVLLHEVAAMVELREWGPALDIAARLPRQRVATLPRERRAHLLLDVALAHSLGGQRDEATWVLLEADAMAPKEVRCRPVARDLIADLVRRARTRPSAELRRLAANAGIPT
jgi:transcriptional regulator with XRE-family HTH domain